MTNAPRLRTRSLYGEGEDGAVSAVHDQSQDRSDDSIGEHWLESMDVSIMDDLGNVYDIHSILDNTIIPI